MAIPIISKEKIFNRVDFGFISNLKKEIISRHDHIMFSSNTMGKIEEEIKERELKEDFLFRYIIPFIVI